MTNLMELAVFFVYRRIIGIYCVITLLMTVLIYRIYYINAADYLTMAAAGQGSYNLTVATTRGVIYDRNMKPLVGNIYEYVASILPSPQAASALLPIVTDEQKPAMLEKLSETTPFAMVLDDSNIYAKGVDIFRIPMRYGGFQYAPHIIGYLDGDGKEGVAGLELAFNKELKAAGGKVSCIYQIDAAGHVMSGAAMSVARENEEPVAGVCLTLDREIQMLVQSTLAKSCEKAGAVVMDTATGSILAMASVPVFDQNDIAASLESPDAPFISRAVSGYNIGSVFKLVVSAAALEKGVSAHHEHVCEGYVDIGGVVFRCNNNAVHGVCDMQRALQVSCNTYFITLAQEVGAEYLLSYSENLGLGKAVTLSPGITTQPGNLPGMQELVNPAALANFGFGQGSSLATPLQMATIISAIANGGSGVQPRLVRGFTEDGLTLEEPETIFAANRLLSENNAAALQGLMVGVVTDGSGRTAAPASGGAGGKTSSAQTGILEDGGEIVHAWFAGFYPAGQPQYAIVVFVENGQSGEYAAAPLFKAIADGIYDLRYQPQALA